MRLRHLLLPLVLLLAYYSSSCLATHKKLTASRIHQIKSISEINSWVIPGALVLFDLDNTVFESESVLGHANWYHDQIKKHPEERHKVLARSRKGIMNSSVKPVEEITVDLIKNLQSRGIHVMAFTARNMVVAEVTIKQVASIGLDFSLTSLTGDSKYVRQGILFAHDDIDKGDALAAFLRKSPRQPQRIILADDVLHNLESVCKTTDAIGLHYTIVEEKRDTHWDEKESDRLWQLEEGHPHSPQ